MPPTTETVTQIDASELKNRLDRGEPIAVLDVREDDERAFCAIPLPPTARDLHIPMNDVPNRLDEVRAAVGSGPLVVYCHHGMRSLKVATWLARNEIRDV